MTETIKTHHKYHCQRSAEDQIKMKGGVAILIRISDHLPHKMIHHKANKTGESITASITPNNEETQKITSIYIPPTKTKTPESKIAEMLPNDIGEEDKWLIGGDFNMHHPAWDTHTADYNESGEELITYLIGQGAGIANDPETHTREARHNNKRTLSSPDITATKNLPIATWETAPDIHSDHKWIITKLENVKQTQDTRHKRKFWALNEARWEAFEKTTEENIQKKITKERIFMRWTELERIIIEAAREHIPRGVHKDFKPLWTKMMKDAKHHAEETRKTYEANPTEANAKKLKEAKEQMKDTYTTERRKALTERIKHMNTGNPDTWRFIRNTGRIRKEIEGVILKDDNGNELTTGKQKAEALADRYEKVATKHPEARQPTIPTPDKNTFRRFTYTELETGLGELKEGKAAGPDMIPAEMLKHLGSKGKQQLLHIINDSYYSGYVDPKWKRGHIIPILKPEKDANKVESYRPITLTSHMSKLVERMIVRRIIYNTKNTFNKSQYGFRKGRSTVTALMDLVDYIDRNLSDYKKQAVTSVNGRQRKDYVNNHVLAIMIDFSSAFDTMDHAAIIETLIKKGATNYDTRWVANFLKQRTTKIKCGDHHSSIRSFTSGVPQGTVLGPLLFIMAMDPLLEKLEEIGNLRSVAYADDLTLAVAARHMKEATPVMQNALNAVSEWTQWSKMKVNMKKTEGMIFTNGTSKDIPRDEIQPGDVKYDGEPVNILGRVEDKWIKLLGMHMDPSLRCHKHTIAIKTKTQQSQRQMSALASTTYGKDRDTLICFTKGYTTTKITYAAEIYYYHLGEDERLRINHKHKEQIRIATGACRGTDNIAIHIEANTWPLEYTVRQHIANNIERTARGDQHCRKLATEEQPPISKQRGDYSVYYESPVTTARKITEEAIKWAGIPKPIREPIILYPEIPPWETEVITNRRIQINPWVKKGIKKGKLTKAQQKEEVEKQLQSLGEFDIEIWTDGSSTTEDKISGAAYHTYVGNDMVDQGKEPAGTIACSYSTERIALRAALRGLKHMLKGQMRWVCKKVRILIAPDCQSMIISMLSGPLKQQDAVLAECWEIITEILKLAYIDVELVIQHVFSHCGLPRNDKVDEDAKEAQKKPQHDVPMAYRDIKAIIKAFLKHQWEKELLKEEQKPNDEQGKSYRVQHFGTKPPPKNEFKGDKQQQVLATKIRTGKVDKLGTYARKINETMPHSCRFCSTKDHTKQQEKDEEERKKKKTKKQATDKATCEICHETLGNRASLSRHMKTTHKDIYIQIAKKCTKDGCGKTFALQEELENHTLKKHPEDIQQQPKLERGESTGPTETILHLLNCTNDKLCELRTKLNIPKVVPKVTSIPIENILRYFFDLILILHPP